MIEKHHITDLRGGLKAGYNHLSSCDNFTGMDFSILKLSPRQEIELSDDNSEMAVILLGGYGNVTLDSIVCRVNRENIFTQKPWAFLVPPCETLKIINRSDIEFLECAIIKTGCLNTFSPTTLMPDEIPSEQRGKGMLGGTMRRVVRAIFGDPNSPKHARPMESSLVIGEVLNFQGRWSSYPPHGHAQPELYYYRFDKPQGYGFSHISEPAPVVRTHDVVQILDGIGHDQCAAPGYTMWYLWAIRHLPGKRYEGNPPFTFEEEHKWVLDSSAEEKIIKPKDVS